MDRKVDSAAPFGGSVWWWIFVLLEQVNGRGTPGAQLRHRW